MSYTCRTYVVTIEARAPPTPQLVKPYFDEYMAVSRNVFSGGEAQMNPRHILSYS